MVAPVIVTGVLAVLRVKVPCWARNVPELVKPPPIVIGKLEPETVSSVPAERVRLPPESVVMPPAVREKVLEALLRVR